MTMEITSLIILGILIILIALWNGYVIKWKLIGKGSKEWHIIGMMIRALLVGLVYLNTKEQWWYTAGAAFLCWLPYNMIINAINGWKLFYIGKTSAIDKWIRRTFKCLFDEEAL